MLEWLLLRQSSLRSLSITLGGAHRKDWLGEGESNYTAKRLAHLEELDLTFIDVPCAAHWALAMSIIRTSGTLQTLTLRDGQLDSGSREDWHITGEAMAYLPKPGDEQAFTSLTSLTLQGQVAHHFTYYDMIDYTQLKSLRFRGYPLSKTKAILTLLLQQAKGYTSRRPRLEDLEVAQHPDMDRELRLLISSVLVSATGPLRGIKLCFPMAGSWLPPALCITAHQLTLQSLFLDSPWVHRSDPGLEYFETVLAACSNLRHLAMPIPSGRQVDVLTEMEWRRLKVGAPSAIASDLH